MSSITLENIRKTYGRGGPAAIGNLNMEIGKSEFLCLLGPSGCGKTTTLRMIAGLEHPTGGRILVDGKPIVSVALRQITFLPYLVPGIAFAAAYLSMFAVARPPLPALYGTHAILVLAILADQMPFASRAGISSMMQLGREPEEAGQIVGAGWFRRMRSIVLPIQRSALVSAILLPFISGIKGLSLVVVLAVPGTDLLTTYAIRLVDYGYSQAANAVVVMLCVVAFAGTMLVQKIGKASLSDGMGSK